MRNIKPYSGNSLEFYQQAIASRRPSSMDPSIKIRLQLLEARIKQDFEEFDKKFSADRLQDLSTPLLTVVEKEDLQSLYAYKKQFLQKLKTTLTTTEFNRINNTCQYCTIGEIGAFDHTVPQSEFSNYCVHPHNLFPACGVCNGFKSSNWRANGERLFLNLYLDKLPVEQYLFVDVDIANNNLSLRFYIDNKAGIAGELYSKIKHHYDTLELCTRFPGEIAEIISSLVSDVNNYQNKLPFADIRENILSKCFNNKIVFGHNFWQSVLLEKLVDHPEFLNFCSAERARVSQVGAAQVVAPAAEGVV